MRNLKKVLSLTLALVMLLGMMVVGAGAATEYTDKADIQYKEAVEVMSAIGVIDGVGGGKFDPAGNLTRAQAAKLITYMVLGKAVADKLPNTGSKFVDCPENEWYVGSVNYLTDLGIVSGVGGGKFDPESQVTGVEFAKMLLGILGYDAKNEKFVDDPSWAANIAVRARQAGLDANMTTQTVNTVALTRDQAAMMGFNTLTATMQSYIGGVEVTNADGTTVKVGGQLTPVANATGTKGQYNNTIESGTNGLMQFCEQYFPGLKLTDSTTKDNFGRPANQWVYDKKDITLSSNSPDSTLSGNFTSKALYSALGRDVVSSIGGARTLSVYMNGLEVDGDAGNVAETFLAANDTDKITDVTGISAGKGTVTEVFVGDTKVTVCVMNTYIGKVTKTATKDDETTVTIEKKNASAPAAATTFVADGFEKGDYVLYTVGRNGSKYVIESMTEAESITGKITAYSGSSYLRLDGEKYEYNHVSNNASATGEAVIYLDASNNVIYVGSVEAEAAQYLYVKGADKYFDTISVRAVFPDGTSKIVTVDGNTMANLTGGSEAIIDTVANESTGDRTQIKLSHATDAELGNLAGKVSGKIYSYTADGDKYLLEPAGVVVKNEADGTADANGEFESVKITKGSAALYNAKPYTGGSLQAAADSTMLANSSTVYVVVDSGKVYTGFRSVPSMNGVSLAYVSENSKVADLVFITTTGTTVDDPNAFYFYVASATDYEDGDVRLLNKAYVDGELTPVKIANSQKGTVNKAGLYKAERVSEDGTVSSLSAVIGWKEDINSKNLKEDGVLVNVAAGGTLELKSANAGPGTGSVLDGTIFTYDDDTLFVTVAKDGSVNGVKGEAGDIALKTGTAAGDSIYRVYVVSVKSGTNMATVVYVAEFEAAAPAALTSVTLGQGSDQKPTLTTETDVTTNNAGTTDWASGSKDKIKIDVVAAAGTTATIKINNTDYTSGDNYTITAKADLTVEITVTVTETGVKSVLTYTVKVA